MNNIKKITAILLIFTLTLGLSTTAFAKEDISKKGNDLEKVKVFKDVIEESDVKEEILFGSNKQADAYSSYWTQFSRPYYEYVDMSFEQISAYNKIYNSLYELIEGGENITEYQGGYYLTPGIEISGLTDDEAKSICFLMLYDHPELYFLDAGLKINDVKNTNKCIVQFAVYDDLTLGKERAECSNALKTKIESIKPLVTGNTPIEIEKQIHDLIIKNVSYETYAPYSQSIISVFLTGKTVCAGYSEAFAALCCAFGIPAISVISETHEWNQVYLDGLWYAVDLTWDDDDNGEISYDCLNISDSTLRFIDKDISVVSHTPEEATYKYVKKPSCNYNYVSRPEVKSEKNFRLYNPNTGEHFYTKNNEELKKLVSLGWEYEGVAWTTLQIADVPIYRLYNPNSGQHHYTKNEQEKNYLDSIGWKWEGISFYTKSIEEKNDVYRLYNPNSGWHHYTISKEEKDNLVNLGWQYEGISWKVS